ncbi:MAG: Ribulosamine/erythrulosamine 3-kinase potentially involved in protein deglycation [uncultured Corynebacteriales bacterium]|uniref:Ribulosamine/erythrulosamine 3-kinase potentially involved in protein deglycation n=1 Tax=uncultured Mycobacteriales bacterium TaxID=581187 RepID=A0A6J4IUF6_9ACTN|nr:MAG: Ribulosamine/erythrulosamine 3-kinase potentially involved in protein deglycation [uncultured Corynebacteriales bacterium]
MDLSERVAGLLDVRVTGAESYGRAVTGERWKLRLADGGDVFVKARPGAPDGFFAVEADGLAWLNAAPGGPPRPAVLAWDAEVLVLPWLPAGRPSPPAVHRLAGGLAALHAAGAPVFGAARDGWIGAAALDNRPCPTWPDFYGQRRVLPYVRMLRDSGGIGAAEVAVFERLAARLLELAGPAEPPARIHGDLWSGNVLWAYGRGWLVDPAAHGGHRETDLAMLTLFGGGWVPALLAAYDEAAPLADGWRDRQRLHQVHPLLVHAVLFPGGGYLDAALDAARHYR